MRPQSIAAALAVALALASGLTPARLARAQAPTAAQTTAPAPTLAPVQATRASQPIVIDGRLEEPAWNDAQPVDAFTQQDPDQGQAPRHRTVVRVMYDDDGLLIGARMYDSSPDSIVSRLSRRDGGTRSDDFGVHLDPYHDKRTGYYFHVNAAGVLSDGTIFNDGWDDDSWDGVWHAHTHRDAEGWTAEMRIPFSQLRYNAAPPVVWGINFTRYTNRCAETARLVYTPRGQSGYVSRFPELQGLEGLRTNRTIELTPYTTGKSEFLVHDEQDPFRPDGGRHTAALGADLRTSLGANLTLSATANPDFGQVEIDPAVVNLSDVESFFNEKRPFFVEGSSVFRTGNNGANDYWGFNWPEPVFFYSRRVGRSPQGFAGSADYVDLPVAARILGAAKVTGQIAKGLDFGTLHAVTGREQARLSTSGVETRGTVEPATYFGVLRGMKELNDRRQGVGVMTTMSHRFFEDGSSLEDQMTGTSLLSVLDGWTFLDEKRTWVVSGWAGGSLVQGTEAMITRLQRNSVHYYQRPDVSHVGVDTEATSLAGHGARLWINKQNGRVFMNSAFGYMSPGFENNDLGFLSRADVINGHVGTGYKWEKPNGIRQYAHIIGSLWSTWDMAGTPQAGGLWMGGNHEFKNRWSSEANLNINPERLSVRATRGGPVMRLPASRNLFAYFDTDGGKPWFWSINGEVATDDGGGRSLSSGVTMQYRPRSNLTLSFGPSIEDRRDNAQYLTRVADATETVTFGNRYVFAEIEQKTASAELRLDYSMTPNLSFQLYAQPLISSGRYSEFKQLARGRTYDFTVYGQDNGSTYDANTGEVYPDGAGPAPSFNVGQPDFTFRSIRGNAVVRWEYMPGSTLYLVWTQNRAADESIGEFDLNRSLSQLSRTEADNVFLVKFSHHFEL